MLEHNAAIEHINTRLLLLGYYLYVGYPNGVAEVSGAGLRSPTFPPPPKYNNNASSPYYKTCRVSPIVNILIFTSTSRYYFRLKTKEWSTFFRMGILFFNYAVTRSRCNRCSHARNENIISLWVVENTILNAILLQLRLYYNAKVKELSLSQLEVVVLVYDSNSGSSSFSTSKLEVLTTDYKMDMKTEGWQRWEAVLPSHIQLRSVDQCKSA